MPDALKRYTQRMCVVSNDIGRAPNAIDVVERFLTAGIIKKSSEKNLSTFICTFVLFYLL